MILDRVIILCLATSLSVSTSVPSSSLAEECDVFGYNTVCDLSASHIVAVIPELHGRGYMDGWRYMHAAVNIPAGSVTCKPN